MDIVRVLRVIEYVGTRERVELVVQKSIHGTKVVDKDLTIRAASVGDFPELINLEQEKIAAFGSEVAHGT